MGANSAHDDTIMVGWKCSMRSLLSAWVRERCLRKSLFWSAAEFYVVATSFLASRLIVGPPGWAVLPFYFDEIQGKHSARWLHKRGEWECLCQCFLVLFSQVVAMLRQLLWLLALLQFYLFLFRMLVSLHNRPIAMSWVPHLTCLKHTLSPSSPLWSVLF